MGENLPRQPESAPSSPGATPEIESQFMLGLRRLGLCEAFEEPGTVPPERPPRYRFDGGHDRVGPAGMDDDSEGHGLGDLV